MKVAQLCLYQVGGRVGLVLLDLRDCEKVKLLEYARNMYYNTKMNCKKHPRYTAKRKPRVDCPDCWRMYQAKQKENKSHLGRKING
jgi:hypothetical protein